MKETFRLIYQLTDRRQRWIFPGLLLADILVSLLEVLSLGTLIPFVATLVDPQQRLQFPFVEFLQKSLQPTKEGDFLFWISLLVIVLFAAKNLFSLLLSWLRTRYSHQNRRLLAHRLFCSYQKKPWSFYQKNNTTSLLRRMEVFPDIFHKTGLMAFTVIGQGILVFFILLFLFWLDGVVFLLLSLSMAFFSILFLRFSNRRVQTLGEDIHHLEESRDQTVIHGLEGIRETRLFQCETFFQEKLQNVLRKLEVTEANFSLYSAIPRSFLEFFTVSIVIVVVLLLVGRGVNTQEILVKISVFAVAAYKLLPSLALLINSLTYITYGQHSLQILAEDINASENHSEIDCPENQNVDFSFSQNIRFEKITFTYPERQTPVLNELSFTIKKNQVTGLTGVSGSGKTTAVDLLLGFLEPKSGTILVDGLLIDRNSSAWRSKIASVSQNVYIADLSLKENIAFGVGEEQFDEQLFAKVLQMAELTDFAAELPQGSATMVGERGICLSGGQKQRVGIARALYSCPEILILDEATSFLDSCMEEKILGGIKSEFTPMTVLFITHRISAMKHCQNVLYLQDGVISEAGSFEQLPKNLIPTQ